MKKFIVVYMKPLSDITAAETPEDACRIVKHALTNDCRVLGCYPMDGPVPPEFDGLPRPPTAPARAVA